MAENLSEKVAEALIEIMAEHRKAQGLTLEELADQAGIHRTTVGLLERRERGATIDSALRLAGALGVELSVLLARAEAMVSGQISKTAAAVKRRALKDANFHNEDALKAKTGLSHEAIKKAMEGCYQTVDTIDFELLLHDSPPMSQLVELANLSSMLGNLLGGGVAAHSNGLYRRNKPHSYPDLLPAAPNKRNLELKMALETNRPKGHLPKAGTYLTFRYVLTDKAGVFRRGVKNRGDTVFVWEVKVGEVKTEDFDLSNTEGDSGKTAVIKSEVFEAMSVIYYEPSLLPYAKARTGYPDARQPPFDL